MASKIRFNDDVVILCGKDRGKIGKIKLIISKKNKVIVQGINFIKRHQKAIPSKNQVSGIIKREAPIHVSNVAILNVISKKADRIGFRFESGKKVRFLKSNNQTIK